LCTFKMNTSNHSLPNVYYAGKIRGYKKSNSVNWFSGNRVHICLGT
jgi:hypothetical protein